jgi:hypothetical protein
MQLPTPLPPPGDLPEHLRELRRRLLPPPPKPPAPPLPRPFQGTLAHTAAAMRTPGVDVETPPGETPHAETTRWVNEQAGLALSFLAFWLVLFLTHTHTHFSSRYFAILQSKHIQLMLTASMFHVTNLTHLGVSATVRAG